MRAGSAAEGAAHGVRLCDPAVEIVNGAYHDRDERPAPAATEDRTIRRRDKPADLPAGRTACRRPTAAKPARTDDEPGG